MAARANRPSSNNPETLGAMHCFFISVSGTGIVPSEGSARLNSRNPECFGLGTTTKGVKLSELISSDGYTFRIPLGPNRQVSVYGAYSSVLGTSCTGKDFGDLFGYEARPRVYLLGRTTTDLFRDSAVAVTNTYNYQQADDLAETCPVDATAKAEPGDATAAAPLKGTRLYVAQEAAASAANFFSYAYSSPDQLIQKQATFMNGNAVQMQISNDHTRLMNTFTFTTGGRAQVNSQLYRLETQGDNAGDFTFKGQASVGDHHPNGFLSIDPLEPFAFYLSSAGFSLSSYRNENLIWEEYKEVGLSSARNLVAVGDYVYVMVQPGPTALNVASYRRTSNSGTMVPLNLMAYAAGAAGNEPGKAISNGSNFIYLAAGNYIHPLRVDLTSGALALYGMTAQIPLLSGTAQIAEVMSIDREKKNLYVLTRDDLPTPNARGYLLRYSLDANGGISSVPDKQIDFNFQPVAGALDYSGRYYFVAGVNSKILYYFDFTEAFAVKHVAGTLTQNIQALASVPIL